MAFGRFGAVPRCAVPAVLLRTSFCVKMIEKKQMTLNYDFDWAPVHTVANNCTPSFGQTWSQVRH